MKLTRAAICLQLIFLCTAMTLAHPQQGRFSVAGLDSDREVEGFFLSFREAIAKGDEKTVASMVSYPIRVTLVSGQRKKIRSVAGFIAAYHRIFDDEFRRVIAKTTVKDLWANSSGVAMPSGEIWFNGIVKNMSRPERYTLRITAINGPIRPGVRR